MTSAKSVVAFAVLTSVVLTSGVLASQYRVQVEFQAVGQTRNDVQIPNDSTGTRFDLTDLGTGPYPGFRTTIDWTLSGPHSLRLTLAPLTIEDEGTFDKEVVFDDVAFAAGERTESTYRFNSYRLGYRYRLVDAEDWTVHVGATAKVRDAEIELKQGDTSSSYDNVGVVPLLHVDAEYSFGRAWSGVFDAEFAAAPQGRAFDVAVLLKHSPAEDWDISTGYRTLEGGADNDDVYTFAWLHYAVFSVGYNF